MKHLIIFVIGLIGFSIQAKNPQLSWASEHTPARFDQSTGKCLVCNGLLKVYNAEYNKKKIGSQKIIICPCCKGRGKIQQSLTSLWGIKLYEQYSAAGGKIQEDKSIKYLFSPKKKYRKFKSYSFSITPSSKQIYKICSQYQAKSKREANREMDIVIQQLKRKYKEVTIHVAFPISNRVASSRGVLGGRDVGTLTAAAEMIFYDPKKISHMKVIRNLDAEICVSVSHKNVVEIVMSSRDLAGKVEMEARKISSSDSDLEAL